MGAGTMRLARREEALPGFVDPGVIYGDIAAALRPPRKISVSEAAERHRRLSNPGGGMSGAWRNAVAPYLVEPMDRSISRDIDELVFIGPSQAGKTEIPLNVIGHAIKYRAADVLVIQPTRDLAIDFGERRLENKMLDCSPDLAAELGAKRTDDKTLSKQFRNGMMVSVAWPVAGQLASRPVPIVIIDERDRMPDNIGGEGDPVALGRNRKKTFGRAGVVIVTSSPSRATYSGIVPLYDAGDRNVWAWPCPDCGEFWTPGFNDERQPDPLAHLKWIGATPEEARRTAFLVCPHCGVEQTDKHKATMNARGVWLPEGVEITAAGEIIGARPARRVASYWLSGLVSSFVSLGDLAADYVAAEELYAKTEDEERLQTVYNTGFGIPYRSRAGGDLVSPDKIRDRVEEGVTLGRVPPGARFLTASVDVQKDRFEVAVTAWRETRESWLVDRFAIRQLDDGRTDIDPAAYPEHWAVLIGKVLTRVYPLADDPRRGLRIARCAIDSGGAAGVTDNAVDFWWSAAARKLRRRIMLVKGAATRDASALPKSPTFVEGRHKGRRGAPVYVIGVHRLKDSLATRLRRRDPGPGYIHFPGDTPDRVFDELAGERKDAKGLWQRVGANESFDLLGYADAAFRLLKPHRVRDWSAPPSWARPVAIDGAALDGAADEAAHAVRGEIDSASDDSDDAASPAATDPVAQAMRTRRPLRRRGGFVGGWRVH